MEMALLLKRLISDALNIISYYYAIISMITRVRPALLTGLKRVINAWIALGNSTM